MPLKPFRWKGPGVLHIRGKDKLLREVQERAIVQDRKELETLGFNNIKRLVREGHAEYVPQAATVNAFLGIRIQEALESCRGGAS